MNNKTIYKAFCDKTYVPLFSQPWWMDAACGETNWDVILVREKDTLLGTLPYQLKNKYGFRYIFQPAFTQTNGLWIIYPENKVWSEYEKLSFDKKVCNLLISQLEHLKVSFYQQNYHFSFTNWLPFYWKGFKQTTRYTYQLRDIKNIENIYAGFEKSKKKHIKKCMKEGSFVIKEMDGEAFFEYHKASLAKKNIGIYYHKDLFNRLYTYSKNRNQGVIFKLEDHSGNIHCAIFLVWDKKSGYSIMTAIDPDFRSSGATTMMFFESFKFLSDKTEIFDFSGSMDEGIENSFRKFGAVQVPYFQIEKSYSFLFNVFFYMWRKCRC